MLVTVRALHDVENHADQPKFHPFATDRISTAKDRHIICQVTEGRLMLVFSMRYAGAELRRRWSRALITALGLAAGVSLIVAITSISSGFNRAGAAVLAPLGNVGTDILVTQAASSGSSAQDIVAANHSLVTNLASLGKPGDHFTKDFFLLADLLPVKESLTHQLAALPHVAGVSGALTVLATHQTGVVPKIVASLTTGGQTLSSTHKPTPLSDSEATTMRACIVKGSGIDNLTGVATGTKGSSAGLSAQIQGCLPERYRQYVQQINVPLQTVRQVLNPPQTNIKATNYTVVGIDPTNPADGLINRSQVVSGSFIDAGSTDQLLADTTYASSHRLLVGSIIPINGTGFHIVGIVNANVGGQSANLYFPLKALQHLTGQSGQVNLVVVKADNANNVEAVTSSIKKVLPHATLVTAADVASQVKSSLTTAKHLTSRFGGALAIVVLTGALLITVLLTLGSVAKRVREIGTLRAVGWSRRRMVGQLVVETVGIGAVGAVIGIVLGIIGGIGLTHIAPPITIHSPLAAGSAALAKLAGVTTHSEVAAAMHIKIGAHINPTSLLVGAGLALGGSLIAGVLAGWRASSLTPAVALRDLG